MNELSLIAAIRRYTATPLRDPHLVASIGDDCAVLRPRAGEDLLITTDFLIEDVHFRRSTHSGVATGWRALARGLSDIAAMGGAPRYALVSLALAPWTRQNYVRDFYRGLNLLASKHKVRVIGGDLTRTAKLTVDIVVVGGVPRGKALTRSGARPGDILYVTGPLGRAASRKFKDRPEPHVGFGRRLLGKATACMDLSDGLALDLHRLCLASGVAAVLDGILPSAPGASLEQVLFGGEDYELLCSLPPRARPPAFLTRVGAVLAGKSGDVTFAGTPLPPKGWDPLASESP